MWQVIKGSMVVRHLEPSFPRQTICLALIIPSPQNEQVYVNPKRKTFSLDIIYIYV